MDLQEFTGNRLLWPKNRLLSVVTPTFVDGAFVTLCMANILPVGPITISVFLVRAILVWESVIFSENPSPVSHGISGLDIYIMTESSGDNDEVV